jgi:hypothetical protein
MHQLPKRERRRAFRVKRNIDQAHSFGRHMDFPGQARHIAFGAPQAEAFMARYAINLEHIPGQTARTDPDPWPEIHSNTARAAESPR